MYSVIAYRWGHPENHSYVIGLFDDHHFDDAMKAAEDEQSDRGGKYYCEIRKHAVNKHHQGKPVWGDIYCWTDDSKCECCGHPFEKGDTIHREGIDNNAMNNDPEGRAAKIGDVLSSAVAAFSKRFNADVMPHLRRGEYIMSFYNSVVVVFTFGNDGNTEDMDFRTAGQALPSGSIPLAIVNFNTHQYFEVINAQEPEFIMDWLDGQFESDDELYINDFMKSDAPA